MSLNRHNCKRDKNEKEIVDSLEKIGATVQRLNESGCPDLLVGWRSKNYLFEVKSVNGRCNEIQLDWHAGWKGSAFVIHSIEDALYIMYNSQHIVGNKNEKQQKEISCS